MKNLYLTKEQLKKDYKQLVDNAEKLFQKLKFDEALEVLRLSSNIAYSYNCVPSYCDSHAENIIFKIAQEILPLVSVNANNECICFYDYFGQDNKCLTQQYIRAIIASEKELVYILENEYEEFKNSDIFLELTNYSKARIYILEKVKPLVAARQILGIIASENPYCVLMQLAPWDTIACLAFSRISGVKRFQINLTDHAFWLGVGILDYCLEFREYGINLSVKKRGIPIHKLKRQPYYPIINEVSFQGLPTETQNKKIIFSGASIYKIQGDNLYFLKLVKKLLQLDEDLVFVFAGGGNQKSVLDFITENHMKQRCFFIGERTDFSALCKRANYFLTTFPVAGGLATQIAVQTQTPIYVFGKKGYLFNDLDGLFQDKKIKTEYDEQKFIENFRDTYNDDVLLMSVAKELKKGIITIEEFNTSLLDIIYFPASQHIKFLDIDIEHCSEIFCSEQLTIENEQNPQYFSLKIHGLRPNLLYSIFPNDYRQHQKMLWQTDKTQYVKNLIKFYLRRIV